MAELLPEAESLTVVEILSRLAAENNNSREVRLIPVSDDGHGVYLLVTGKWTGRRALAIFGESLAGAAETAWSEYRKAMQLMEASKGSRSRLVSGGTDFGTVDSIRADPAKFVRQFFELAEMTEIIEKDEYNEAGIDFELKTEMEAHQAELAKKYPMPSRAMKKKPKKVPIDDDPDFDEDEYDEDDD